MELPKTLILLLCYLCHSFASEQEHTIPIEGYESELQDLGQHVEIPETPVKVIKITKTIAVKVPVPYPVKVIEKVPYPVHVSKPYPVPVPQIIHVPHGHAAGPKSHHEHEGSNSGHGNQNTQHFGHEGQSYQVQETPSSGGHSFLPSQENHDNGHSDYGQYYDAKRDEHTSGITGSSYDAPISYHGYSGDSDGNGSDESKTYDKAIKKYLQKYPQSVNSDKSGYHYH